MKPFVMDCDISCFRALDVPIESEDNCSILNTGASSPLLNCVVNHPSDNAKLEQTAEKIIGHFQKLGLGHSWWVETDSEPSQLASILKNHDMQLLGEFPGMALDLSLLKDAQVPNGLTFVKVSTEDQFSLWSEVIAKAFEFSESDAGLYASLFIKAGTQGPFEHLIGKKDGKIVCTGTLLCTETGAYLYNIATPENERGKGYGSSITHALLQMAKQKNQSRVGLVSSPEAASIYRKLGFKDVCQFHIYV